MAANLTGPKRTVVAINGSGGAAVIIRASCFARYVEIQECPPNAGAFTGGNYAPTGLNYQRPDDNFTATFGLNPGTVFSLGDFNYPRDRGVGVPQHPDPSGTLILGTPYIQAKSATAGATQVEVREFF